eukprot:GHUV01022830.1.p2 GENE.GHUV01022830.1~~GHUV01022830.1.p2  ORF type:complete len:215 (-),score=38.72 GHUV01022830.1:1023-1667(-)
MLARCSILYKDRDNPCMHEITCCEAKLSAGAGFARSACSRWCKSSAPFPADSKMDKRRKGVYGPPAGKRCIIFVDDLNMPQRERYFAQPPLELLRQWFDHGGWYERKPPCAFKNIVDTQFVGAMGPPGGGRNPVSARLLRHFNFLSFAELSDESVERIFSTILGAFFRKYFVESIANVTQQVRGGACVVASAAGHQLLPVDHEAYNSLCYRTCN